MTLTSKNSKKKSRTSIVAVFLAATIAAFTISLFVPKAASAGGIIVYEDETKYVKLGGRIQIQYNSVDPDGGDQTDSLSFRRLRPYIEGSLHKDWKGKFQFDLGGAGDDNEISVKDAYIRYKGFKGVRVTIGNEYFAFSREVLTSSKYQQLIELTLAGDHNYGTPDRNLGVHLAGELEGKNISYRASVASASVDPDSSKLDMDTPANAKSDFNEGWIYGARIEYHPFGKIKFSQGNFDNQKAVSLALGAYAWANDDDNNTRTTTAGLDTSGGAKPDVDSITALELSTAIRYAALSADVEYNSFNAETVDDTVTAGIYEDGSTTLTNLTIEGGYMVLPETLEIVAGYETQDADNYAEQWTRSSIGANYFIKRHDIKFQTTLRKGENTNGVDGADVDEFFAQMQFVF